MDTDVTLKVKLLPVEIVPCNDDFYECFFGSSQYKEHRYCHNHTPCKKKIQNKTKQKLIGQSWSIKDHVC